MEGSTPEDAALADDPQEGEAVTPDQEEATSQEALDTETAIPVASLTDEAEAGEQPEPEPEEEIPTPEELRELRKRAEERDSLLGDCQRARADYANLQRRTERDRAGWKAQAVQDLVAELLPVIDQLDLGIASGENCKDVQSMVDGVTMVRSSFLSVLQNFRVEPILAEGQPFDPELHEAVLQEEDPGVPDLTILAEFRKGYALDGKVLRPSQVKVSRNNQEPEPADKDAEQPDLPADDQEREVEDANV